MGRYFGTDGIRGPADSRWLGDAFLEVLGRAAGRHFAEGGQAGGRTAWVGRDPRLSGLRIEAALARGLASAGCAVRRVGLTPTAAVARAAAGTPGAFGVMVTASHNPAGDNGVKFFSGLGRKLPEAEEARLEDRLEAELAADMGDTGRGEIAGGEPPGEENAGDLTSEYVAVLTELGRGAGLAGQRVVLDTANGATRRAAPEIFRALGAEVRHLGGESDGAKINDGCGSEHPEVLAAAVVAEQAAFGFAFDGDGDRVVAVDAGGRVVDGDQLLGLMALDGLRRGWLREQTLVTTIQSNTGLVAAVEGAGGRVVRVGVGDRLVSEALFAAGWSFGGESSGHLVFPQLASTGDGILAALRVAEVVQAAGRPLAELAGEIRLFPQVTRNLRVAEKRPLEECAHLREAQRQWEEVLAGRGRILVRYSGTEAKLRLLAEAGQIETAEAALADLVTAAQKDLASGG